MAIISSGALATIQEMLFQLADYIITTITVTDVDNQQSILEAINDTLWNALNILNAYSFYSLLSQEYALLSRLSPIDDLGLNPTDATYVTNRLTAINVFIQTVYPLPLWLQFDLDNLAQGKPAIQAYDLEGYLNSFNAETAPAGLTIQTIQQSAQACSNAWNNALLSLQTNGSDFQKSAFNPVDRLQQCCNDNAVNLLNLQTLIDASLSSTISYTDVASVPNVSLVTDWSTLSATVSGLDPTQMWNLLVAMPSIVLDATVLLNDPSTQIGQSTNAVRYLILVLMQRVNAILSSFVIPNVIQPLLGTLHQSETLMDFASRTTGDFSQWSAIAIINNLTPPYVGIMAAPGIAVPGQNLYLPTSPIATGVTLSDYLTGFLGTDIDLGPIGSTLTNWDGDFNTVSGYNNLTASLARRVLTPVGNLIYHQTYGSRLPEQIGSVSTANSAILLTSYLKSALLADPRIQSVASISAQPFNTDQIVLRASVIPKGTTQAGSLNLVLIPTTTGVPKN